VAALVLEATLGLLPQGFRLTTMNAIDLDWRTLTFTALTGFVTVLLFGVPPAWAASKGAVSELLAARFAHRGRISRIAPHAQRARDQRGRACRRAVGRGGPDGPQPGEAATRGARL
jgi:hypothetical protein